MNIANNGKVFTFYLDTYGNVIGRVANTDAKSYVVLDRIYGVHENGKFALKADMFDLDGKALFYGVEPFLCRHYDRMERRDPLKQPYETTKPHYEYNK